MNKKPFVYIAGAGPGNKSYITVKVLELIKKCDVVIYDNLIDNTILDNCKKDCVKIYAGKSSGHHSMKQEEINALIVSEAEKGNTVLRLKGGDPFVFGRGSEECIALKEANIGYEVIPGITSAISVPMNCGIPVTHRKLSRSFTVVTGHTADGEIENSINFKALSQLDGTIVFLMGLKNIEKITAELLKNGMDKNTPCAVISNGTRKNQHICRGNLKDISEKATADTLIVSPAIIVVGKCAALNMLSTTNLPLSKIKTALCGTKDFCTKLSKKIENLGGYTQILDFVQINPVDKSELKKAIRCINAYTVLVFTGPNSIKIFFDTLKETETDIRKLSHLRFAVIGNGTYEYLKNFGIYADIVPTEFTSDSLAHLLVEKTDKSDNILIPRALKGNNVISEILSENNRKFNEIPVYDTICQNIPQPEEDIDFITFASSAGVKGFFESGKTIPSSAKAVCIGKYTAKTLEKYGVNNYITAKTASADSMAETILNEVTNKCSDSED